MKAGLLTVTFRLHGIESLKARRSIVKRLLADVHKLGPSFAVCEMPGDDSLESLTLRVAHLSGDARFTDSSLRRVAERFEHKGDFEVIESSIEIL
jgi:uncharacterized protein YlxP (DUF503 family)